MITVLRLKKTCSAMPAQWEGVTDTGDLIYIRYRWSNLTVGIGENRFKEDIFTKRYDPNGQGYDGDMEFDDLKKHLKDEFVLPEIEDDTLEIEKD